MSEVTSLPTEYQLLPHIHVCYHYLLIFDCRFFLCFSMPWTRSVIPTCPVWAWPSTCPCRKNTDPKTWPPAVPSTSLKRKNSKGLGLVVTGGDSCTEGRGFESQHQILDGYFSHLFVVKIVMFVWKDENKLKETVDGPFKKEFLNTGDPIL